MRSSSLLPYARRRIPVQDRSERRVADFLEQAAAVIAEVGYEATTMTEIASRAGASIGAVYQYFPNKEAITAALRAQYVKELEARWASLETEADRLDAAGLGRKIIEHLIAFSEERPAFIPSLSAPKGIRKDPAIRGRLREQFAALFLRKAPGLSRVEALQIANVTLQVVKGLNELRVEARAHDRPLIVSEYKVLLSRYLTSRLASER